MLELILAQWLAATAPAVEASLELRAVTEQRIELALCFQGRGQRVRYRLQIRSHSQAGTARSEQTGALVADTARQCPLHNPLGVVPDGRISAELRWWIDDVEQPPLERRWPPVEDETPPAPPPREGEVVV
ncbi:hypothetical protein YO5_17120 [Stutzerimonas stutzeri TS44]|nr:hypothetical protein YO5_17120 [Stutzerimonas stutzeri TS44]